MGLPDDPHGAGARVGVRVPRLAQRPGGEHAAQGGVRRALPAAGREPGGRLPELPRGPPVPPLRGNDRVGRAGGALADPALQGGHQDHRPWRGGNQWNAGRRPDPAAGPQVLPRAVQRPDGDHPHRPDGGLGRGSAMTPATTTAERGVAEFRRHFPTLEGCAYLATCSLGARSSDVEAALLKVLGAMDRFGLARGQFEEQVSIARSRFASLIGARPEQIAVLPNASVGAYQVASTLRWGRRPTVEAPVAAFPSVAHVWLAQRPSGAAVHYVPERDGSVEAADYLAAIDE